MLTHQQLFDNAYIGVLKQGGPSVSPSGKCLYRHGDRKCGVGHSLPDELYKPEFDTDSETAISELIEEYPEVRNYFQHVDKNFLTELQDAHDHSPRSDSGLHDPLFERCFKENMKALAHAYGLTIPTL